MTRLTGSSVTITAAGMLDTNILILRPSIDAALLPDPSAISAVVLGELAAGVHHVAADQPGSHIVPADRMTLLAWQRAADPYAPPRSIPGITWRPGTVDIEHLPARPARNQ